MNIPTIILFVVGYIGIISVGCVIIKDTYFSKDGELNGEK